MVLFAVLSIWCYAALCDVKKVCQALVLPPWQRQGHGNKLLHQVYADVMSRKDVYQVTVEDPSPGFTRLRDQVDYEHCRVLRIFKRYIEDVAISDPSDVKSLNAEAIAEMCTASKLTRTQVILAYEIFIFQTLQVHLDSAIGLSCQHQRKCPPSLLKKFRLMVKRRLNSEYAPELSQMTQKADRLAFLEEHFQHREKQILFILSKSARS